MVKTLATLPDVHLMYQSCPGPNGLPLHHIYPNLTCTLQLVRMGSPPCSPRQQAPAQLPGSPGAERHSWGSCGDAGPGAGGEVLAAGCALGGGLPWLTTRVSLCDEIGSTVVTYRSVERGVLCPGG